MIITFYFTVKPCVKPCKRIYKPVCGNNGRTYPNKCEFDNAKCKDDSLAIKHEFMCQDDVKIPDEKNEIKISGKINFKPPIQNYRFPKGACVTIYVQEEILCGQPPCNIPVLAKSFSAEPRLNQDGSYSYKLKFSNNKPLYRLMVNAQAVLGACNGDQTKSPGNGDYVMTLAHTFDIEDGKTDYKKDVEIEMTQPISKPKKNGEL